MLVSMLSSEGGGEVKISCNLLAHIRASIIIIYISRSISLKYSGTGVFSSRTPSFRSESRIEPESTYSVNYFHLHSLPSQDTASLMMR